MRTVSPLTESGRHSEVEWVVSAMSHAGQYRRLPSHYRSDIARVVFVARVWRLLLRGRRFDAVSGCGS